MPEESTKVVTEKISFKEEIRFEDLYFQYNKSAPWILEKFNLVIPKGSRVGFVGSTGSGKSTTLDLLMGLLKPVKGEICVDGKPIRGDLVRAWQNEIAHVPQNIFLADTALSENIAFGIPKEEINYERLRLVTKQAQIDEFVENSPEGYETKVGERGVRLSGGQRQRIGIARALYKNASVLVLDEATSALDSVTEQLIMQSVVELDKELTILMIAHRLTTIKNCDFIVLMNSGRVEAIGSYDELLKTNAIFSKMVNVKS